MRPGLVPRGGLRGFGPAPAGNVGAGVAFALTREGGWEADVPMLTAAQSRCCPMPLLPDAARCEVGVCRAPTLNGLFPNPTEQGQEVAVEDTVDVRL